MRSKKFALSIIRRWRSTRTRARRGSTSALPARSILEINQPTFGAFLTVSVPIFDGFARRHKMETAEAELHAAENELAGARDSAVREVWKAYTDFKTALRKQDSAAKLVTASQNAFDAVLESYKNGLRTYPEILSAQRNLTSARSVSHDTQAAIFTAAAALALSTGDLARPSGPCDHSR